MSSRHYLRRKGVLEAEELGRREFNAFPSIQELEDTQIHEASMEEETAHVPNGREK